MTIKIIASVFVSVYLLLVCFLALVTKYGKRVPTRVGVATMLLYLVLAAPLNILIYI